MTNTTKTDRATLLSLAGEHGEHIAKLANYANTTDPNTKLVGWVEHKVYVRRDSDGSASGVLQAATYTQTQLEVMADHGVGVPAYTNGKGEAATMCNARDAAIRELEAANATLQVIMKALAG